MYVIYRDFGLLSNLSMFVYIIIFLFFLAVIDSVQLTLPGVAGIILSIGMSVDANVIIFGHIREEFRSGKRFAAAVHSGFNKSIRTILDANITTIIAAGILYVLGTGSIKGFAITLFLGVAISMFVSLIIMRSFAKLYLHINRDNEKRFALKMSVPYKGSGKATDGSAETSYLPKVKEKRKLNFGTVSPVNGGAK
jgi:preprotein translocase subunit SecD